MGWGEYEEGGNEETCQHCVTSAHHMDHSGPPFAPARGRQRSCQQVISVFSNNPQEIQPVPARALLC